MNSHSLMCSVCGGTMKPVKVLPNKFVPLIRYKCTCGHCEDLKENRPPNSIGQELVAPDGFQELP